MNQQYCDTFSLFCEEGRYLNRGPGVRTTSRWRKSHYNMMEGDVALNNVNKLIEFTLLAASLGVGVVQLRENHVRLERGEKSPSSFHER